MENLIYNELRLRGISVDVGVVVKNEKDANGLVRGSSWKWISSVTREVSGITYNRHYDCPVKRSASKKYEA